MADYETGAAAGEQEYQAREGDPVIEAACVLHEGPYAIACREFEGFGTPALYPAARFKSLFDLHDVFEDYKHRRQFKMERDKGAFHKPRHIGNMSARVDPQELSQRGP